MEGKQSGMAAKFLIQNREPQRVAVLLQYCLGSLCVLKKQNCVQTQYRWDGTSTKLVALLGKLRAQQQGKERVVRGEECSEVHLTLGPLFCIGNHCLKVCLNSDVGMFQSLQGLHRKVTACISEGLVLATLLPSALEWKKSCTAQKMK